MPTVPTNTGTGSSRVRSNEADGNAGVSREGEPNIDNEAIFFGNDDAIVQQVLQEEDYYARLNVNKTATDEEITNAYRRLARILHPDKHSVQESSDAANTALKAIAEQAFNRISEAYEVLSDPVRRAVFDACGAEGLRVSGWEIQPFARDGQHSSSAVGQSADEIRSMFANMRAEKREQSMIEQTTPHHEVTVSVDASDLFDFREADSSSPSTIRFPNMEINFMQSTQLISAQWPPADRLQFFSTIQYEKGSGNGIIGAEISRPLFNNQVTGELKILTGPGKGLVNHVKLSKRWGSKRTVSCGAFTALTGYGFSRPVLEASMSQSLTEQLSGRVALRHAGRQSTVSTRLDYEVEKRGTFSASVDVGFRHTSLALGWRYTFPGIHEQRVHARVTISDQGDYGFEYGLKRRLTKITKFGGSIDISSRNGVRLRLNLQRFSQVYNIPILLAHDVNFGAIFYATVVPLAVYYVSTKDFLLPKWRAVFISKMHAQFEARRAQTEQRRREAIEYRQLMRSRYDDIVDSEGRQGGLVITHALYGPEIAITRLVREKRVPLVSPLIMAAAVPDATSSFSSMSFSGGRSQPASAYSRDASTNVVVNSSSSHDTINLNHADDFIENVLDVTVALQCLVNTKTRSLQLTAHSKSNLPGFYDCAVGEKKTLLINYLLNGKKHFVSADDFSGVFLPTIAHRVTD